MSFAQVALENTSKSFDKTFDYSIPESLKGSLQHGCRVMVPFGKGNRTRVGLVMALSETAEYDRVKDVLAQLDAEPILNDEMLRLAAWLRNRCYCTYFDAIRLLMPTGFRLDIDWVCTVGETYGTYDRGDFSELQWALLQEVRNAAKPIKEDELLRRFGLNAANPDYRELLQKEIILRHEQAFRRTGDAFRKMVRSVDDWDGGIRLSPKQEQMLNTLREIGAVSVQEICYFIGVTHGVVDGLVKKGAAEYFEEEVYRIPKSMYGANDTTPVILSEEQQRAYESLCAAYDARNGGTSLLYGITGSGKTQVFLALIDYVLANGRNVIAMVPEISLTTQTLQQFKNRYGDRVAVFHSGLSVGERLDEWKRVKKGMARVILGTRSAVFAPLENIGLVLLDEEQEYTYKSENSPRYHARDVARFRCAYHKALCLLASATPSVESYYMANLPENTRGKYGLQVLNQRYGDAQLPDVEIVDMNLELESGNDSVYSSILLKALEDNLAQKKQSILLLNRRGYHTFASCRDCKEVISCPHCSISLTYHSANRRLMCHYCGYSVPMLRACPSCGGEHIRLSGTGTQRAEEQLSELLPDARVLRIDTDTASGRFSLEKSLHAFAEGAYDIIIGTQMVAKGLNFENVTLVGVLNADQSLYSDDFRSNERTFDLLTQVVGRSGRGRFRGRAIIQTTTPENPVLALAARQDYVSFYQREITFRRAMLYPPFVDLFVVGFIADSEEQAAGGSRYFLQLLRERARDDFSELPLRILNPTPATVLKISGKYRYKLVIKCRNNMVFQRLIAMVLEEFVKEKKYAGVNVITDCNPDSIL